VKYTVTIRGRAFEVEIRGGEARVNGETVPASLEAVPGSPLRLLALAHGVEALAMVRQDGGWMVHHAGEVWDAQVVDERTRRLRDMTGGGRAGAGHVVVKAPMPGRVVRVEVEAGAVVRQGQGLVVLEAMKMENELTAPIAGRVTAIQVETGQAVMKGAALVEVSAEA
jgi:biotin carboxyl carrier protein